FLCLNLPHRSSSVLLIDKLDLLFATLNKKILLNILQDLDQLRVFQEGPRDSNLVVELVDCSIGFDSRALLADSCPAIEAGIALVASSRIGLQSVSPINDGFLEVGCDEGPRENLSLR